MKSATASNNTRRPDTPGSCAGINRAGSFMRTLSVRALIERAHFRRSHQVRVVIAKMRAHIVDDRGDLLLGERRGRTPEADGMFGAKRGHVATPHQQCDGHVL